jgi:two-component system alkaline phosphatase synthesis response regulator PhoP
MKTILIVDDEEQIRALLKRCFHDLVINILEAGNGNDALRLIKENPPDLVILDIMMPGMNGVEVCRKVREDEVERNAEASLPIIIFTGKASDADRVIGKVVGATHYISKPCDMAVIKKKVIKLLGLKMKQ